MTNEPSPRPSALLPWSVEGPFPGERPTRKRDGFPAYANIVNRVGVYVSQNLRPDVAALIVDAVNLHEYVIEHNRLNAEKVCELFDERDRLLDIVRRLADRFCDFRFDEEDAAILREARAALGAGETPTGKGVGV